MKKKTFEKVLFRWMFNILFFYLFFLCLAVTLDNTNAVRFFYGCLIWTLLVFIIAFVVTAYTVKRSKKMKTVSKEHRKDIEDERCRELSRVVLHEGDNVMITKQGKVYTYIDKPVEVIIKELD